MRSAIIGAFFAGDLRRRREFVLASSRLTHQSWQAETAALAVAEAIAVAITEGPDRRRVLSLLRTLSPEVEWQKWVALIESSLEAGDSISEFVNKAGLHRGVTGYSLHVVGVALYAWLAHRGDFLAALPAALNCGGDTDTVGAILGAMCGSTAGEGSIPADWFRSILEWPRSVGFIHRVAQRLAERDEHAAAPVRYFFPGICSAQPHVFCDRALARLSPTFYRRIASKGQIYEYESSIRSPRSNGAGASVVRRSFDWRRFRRMLLYELAVD